MKWIYFSSWTDHSSIWGRLLAALTLSIGACAAPGGAPAPPQSAVDRATARTTVGPELDDAPEPARRPACTGAEFEIDLLNAIGVLPEDTLESQREQVRDWVWTVTLGRVKGPVVDQVFSATADEPLLRDDSIAHVLSLPTGTARATTTKGGDVIVLVDVANEPDLRARVLDTVDEQALALGHTPTHVQVFGFDLSQDGMAHVCEIDDLNAAALESAESGFRRQIAKNAEDLRRFLEGGVDLLTAECTNDGLAVSGRRRARDAKAPIGPEHIAALAQDLNEGYIPPERFGTSVAALPSATRADVLERAATLDRLAAMPSSRFFIPMSSDREERANEEFIARLLDWKRQNPSVSSADLLLSATLQTQFFGKPGFSLDPQYTAKQLLARADELLGAMTDSKSLSLKLRDWHAPALIVEQYALAPDQLESLRGELKYARAMLATSNDGTVLQTIGKMRASDPYSKFSQLLNEVRVSGGRQCARYDGPLAGTEAGMTFFYTDVSAKMFARDFGRRSPEGVVPGFESIVNYRGSGAWCREEAEHPRPGTRIWFGLRDEGYVRERSGGLRFAPTTTRLFAKGSPDPGSHERETEPNAPYRRFIRWWDMHYAAISDWEPQYEVLNELMKWSVVTQQARLAGNRSCGNVLRAASFHTDERLATWSAAHPNLRWADALAQFHPTETGTECLPIIRSDTFAVCDIVTEVEGGVDAGSLEQVRAKPVRPATSVRWIERLAGDAQPTVKGDRLVFKKLERSGGGKLTEVELQGTPTRVSFRANVDTAAGQVGSTTVFRPDAPLTSFEKVVERENGSLSVQESNNHLRRAGLMAYDLELAKVRLEVRPGPIQLAKSAGQRLAERMGLADSPIAAAARSVDGLSDGMSVSDGRLVFRIDDGDANPKYAVMSSGGGVRGPPPPADLAFFVGNRAGGRVSQIETAPFVNTIEVRILNQDAAKRYLMERGAQPLTSARSSDVAARARAAVEAGRVADASALLKAALPGMDLDSLARIDAALGKARALAARHSQDAELDRLAFSVAIEAKQRALSALPDAGQVESATRLVAPANFPIEAALPPVVHPRGTPLKPNEQFVTRVVTIPAPLARAPVFESVRGERYNVRALHPNGRAPGEQIGAGLRLLGAGRQAVLVVQCSDDPASSSPRCTVPAPADARLVSSVMVKSVCSKLSNESAKHQCEADAWQCDADRDQALQTPKELECLRRAAHLSPSSNTIAP